MPRLERLRVLAMWHLIGPLSTRLFGYLPWRRLGQAAGHHGLDLAGGIGSYNFV